jgi:predicted RND superfamily exporter protein
VEALVVNPIERIASLVMGHSKVVVLVMVLLTAAIGAGAVQVEQDSSLSQFESDTDEAQAQSFIGDNFDANPNATTVQIIVRNESGNVLTKASLVRSLSYQQRLRNDDTIGPTLAENDSTVGVANVVARAVIVQNRSAALQERGAELERRNQSLANDQAELESDFADLQERNESLQEDRRALERRSQELNETTENLTVALAKLQEIQRQYDRLNDSHEEGRVDDEQYADLSAQIEAEMAATRANATTELGRQVGVLLVVDPSLLVGVVQAVVLPLDLL